MQCLWVGECLYNRFKCFNNFNEFLCIYLGKEWGALMHVQNCLMDVYEIGTDEVLMASHMRVGFLGEIRPGVEPGHG